MIEAGTALKAPKFIVLSPRPLSAEETERFRFAWNVAAEQGGPVVLDDGFKVFAVNAAGDWVLIDSSQVIP